MREAEYSLVGVEEPFHSWKIVRGRQAEKTVYRENHSNVSKSNTTPQLKLGGGNLTDRT